MGSGKDRSRRKRPSEAAAAPVVTSALPSSNARRHWWVAGMLCALALAAYANSFRSGFIFDNKVVIEDDPRIRAVTHQNLNAIWTRGYWYDNSDASLYRPLTTASYLFNYAMLGNGNNPAGYHWINIALHAANALLVYCLGLVLFRRIGPAAALAALWGVHPVLTESVTNLVGRADQLSCLGVLAGLLCRVQAESAAGVRRLAWLDGLAAAATVAIFSKESGIVLIAVMVLYDLVFRKPDWKRSLPAYGAAAIPIAFFLYQRSQVLAKLPFVTQPFTNNPLTGLDFLHSRLTAIQVIGRYMLLLLWPRRLSCDYSYNQIPLFRGSFDNWGDWATLLSLIACLSLAGLAVRYRRMGTPIFFAGLFFVALAPTANIAILVGTIMAERLLYLPAVGFLGCAVWLALLGTDRLREKWPALPEKLPYVAAALCAALLLRTYVRNLDWASDLALFESAARVSPKSFKAHLNLALVLSRSPGTLDRAVAEGEAALAILKPLPAEKDDASFTYPSMGAIYRIKGDDVAKSGTPDAATLSRQWYRKSLEVLTRGETVDQLRSAQSGRSNAAAGRPQFRFGSYQIYQALAATYLRMDEPRKAIEAVEYGSLLRPCADLFDLSSRAYTMLHDPDDAAIALMEGLVVEPDRSQLASELVALYKEAPANCAVEKAGDGASLNMGCALVHGHLCTAAAKVGDLYDRREEPGLARKARLTAAQSFGCPAP